MEGREHFLYFKDIIWKTHRKAHFNLQFNLTVKIYFKSYSLSIVRPADRKSTAEEDKYVILSRLL